MPVRRGLPPQVRNTVANNIIKNGRYALVNIAVEPPVVIDCDLTKEEWVQVLTAVTEFCEINYASVQEPIKRALARS